MVGVFIVVAGGAVAAALIFRQDDRPITVDPGREPVAQKAPSASLKVTSSPRPSPGSNSAQEAGFADLFRKVDSGVVMIRATTCDGTGVGSGFQISDNQVVTAAHVISEAAAVAVARGETAYHAQVIGVDEAADVAVLEISGNLGGYNFEFADTGISAGEPIAVIGHPLGEPLTITAGSASRVDDALWPNFQVDASVNPGNSGGPVIRADGDVIGIMTAKDTAAEGLGYAVRADVVSDLVANPNLLTPPIAPQCSIPLGPEASEVPALPAADELDLAIATTFANYFTGINTGDYQLAFYQLSPRLQEEMTPESFAEGVSTSYDFAFEVRSVEESADGALVWLEFVSLQAPEYGPEGDSCTNWSLDYKLTWTPDGLLLIDRVAGHDDSSGHLPCS